jgi:chitodextrinase
MFNNSTGKVFTDGFLAQLIAWHNQDPVSEREIIRNNAIYARQNNRNPYIDNPSYVAAVWGSEPLDTQAPSAVTSLTVSSTTSNTITLTWTAATDNVAVSGYDIYLNGALKTTSTSLTTTITGLLPSTGYTFYIITRDNARNSSTASASVIGTTEPADTQAPSVVTNLKISNITSTAISLTWNAATDNIAVTSYDIYMNGTLKSSQTGISATITGLLPSTSYTFYIVTRDQATNSSAASESVIGTTEPADTQAPSVVTNLAVSATTSNTVTLTWTAATDNVAVTGYDIYVDGILKATTTSITTTINNLTPSTNYSFYVIAKDEAKNSSVASATVNGSTTALPTGTTNCASEDFTSMPANNSAYTARTWTNGGITWSATDARTDLTLNARAITIRNGVLTSSTVPNGITDLTVTTQLEFSGTAGTFKVKVNGVVVGAIPYSSTATTTTISGINKTGDVIVSFEENSATGNRVKFDDLSWNCNKVLGIEDITDENSFTMYPNPSNGVVKINFPSTNEKYSVQVFSTIGQKVFEKEFTNSSYAVINNLQNGVYFVKIISNGKSVTKKLIVN